MKIDTKLKRLMESSELLYVVGVYEGNKHFVYNNCEDGEDLSVMSSAFEAQFQGLMESGKNTSPLVIISAIVKLMHENPKFREMLVNAKMTVVGEQNYKNIN